MLHETEVRPTRGSPSQYVALLMAMAAFVLVAIAFAADVTEDKPAGPKFLSADAAEASGKPVIELGEMYIEGDLKVGAEPAVMVANRGAIQHNLVVEAGPRTPDLDADKAYELDISTVPAGKHTVYCAIEGHRAAGMEAVLEVDK